MKKTVIIKKPVPEIWFNISPDRILVTIRDALLIEILPPDNLPGKTET